MIAVALVAMLLGGVGWAERMIQRRNACLRRATDYAVRRQVLCCRLPDPAHPTADELAANRRMADYYDRLVQKYEQAARSPWCAIEPDPSPP
jgi:hypothetical protein